MPTVYKYIDQGVSNYWNRGFESKSKHANKVISEFFCFSAVPWTSCKEPVSYMKSLNVARKEETKKMGGGGIPLRATQTRKVMSTEC
jgi:hypothetical protein